MSGLKYNFSVLNLFVMFEYSARICQIPFRNNNLFNHRGEVKGGGGLLNIVQNFVCDSSLVLLQNTVPL